MNEKEIFGSRLKQFRKNLNLTLKALEDLTCLSYSNIARIERGEIFPNFEFLVDLHNKFNLDLHWLITGAGEMYREQVKDSLSSLKNLYPGLPDDECIVELIKCLQVPVIYHLLVASFIPLQKQYQKPIGEYFASNNENDTGEEYLNVEAG
jgi:transcriptional regulator with XRE-family HTH domain